MFEYHSVVFQRKDVSKVKFRGTPNVELFQKWLISSTVVDTIVSMKLSFNKTKDWSLVQNTALVGVEVSLG